MLDLRPDVVLMDIKLPDIPGVQAIELMRALELSRCFDPRLLAVAIG